MFPDTGIHRTKYSPRLDYLPTKFPEIGRTKSEFKDSSDINHILKRYNSTGILPVNKMPSHYGDFSDVHTFQEAHNLILTAERHFSDLPSNIRRRFNNDPAVFLAFYDNPANLEALQKMGLVDSPSSLPSDGEAKPSPEAPVVPEGTDGNSLDKST